MAEKIGYLDGLRGIAALSVVLSHFSCAFYPVLIFGAGITAYHVGPVEAWLAASPLSVFFNGGFAVCVFFVLSGYVLTYKYFATGNNELIVSSAVRRYLRLLPPILCVSIIAFILMSLGCYYNVQASSLSGSAWLPQYNNFTPDLIDMLYQAFWGVFFNNQSAYDNVLWTMTYEFMGSFLVFSFALLFGNMRHRWAFYIAAILLFVNTYYLAFIIGMILADVYNHKDGLKFRIDSTLINLILLTIGLFFGSYYLGGWWGMGLYSYLSGLLHLNFAQPSTFFRVVGAGIVLMVLLNMSLLKSLFNTRISRFLGRISFPLYLVHLIVFFTFSSYLLIRLSGVLSYNLACLIIFMISLPVIICASYVICRLVDEPGIALSKSIYRLLAGESNLHLMEHVRHICLKLESLL